MSLKIHNAPQGVSEYPDPSSWPVLSGETQWCTPDIDMSHTFLEFSTNGAMPGGPIWGELGNEAITLPVTLRLVRNPGQVIFVDGTFMGRSGQQAIAVVMDQPGPWVGNVSGVVSFTGHMTFNLADGAAVDIPSHGWAGIRLRCRTVFPNTDHVDTELVVPFYSVVNPADPEPELGEAQIQFALKSEQTSHLQKEPDMFGIHLVEFRDQSPPILAPILAPTFKHVFGYSYGGDAVLFAMTKCFTYTAILDSDEVNHIPGIVTPSQNDGTIGFFDTIDTAVIAASTPPAGLPAGYHRFTVTWAGDTDTGFIDQYGSPEPADLELKSSLHLLVRVGPNPLPAPLLTLIQVPQVIGLPIAEAQATLVSAGFVVGDVAMALSNVPSITTPGQVFSQYPAPSAQGLPPGTLVNLTAVFGGTPPPPPPPPPQTVTVPNVVGLTQSAAVAAINAAGLTVGTVATDSQTPVESESPAAGLQVKPGTAINLMLGGPRSPV